MNWVLNAEQAGRNSFSLNRVHLGSDLQSQELPLPMHQDRTSRFRLSRNPLQRLSWSNHARVERSEEHTSELQSHLNLVCRLLLEKKKRDTQSHQSRITTACILT